jgi:hypothetical protein
MRIKGGGGGGGGEREREREREKERREETVMKLQLATPKRVNTNARRCCHATIGVYACNHSFTPSFLPSFLVAKFMMAIKFASFMSPAFVSPSRAFFISLLFDLLISHQC